MLLVLIVLYLMKFSKMFSEIKERIFVSFKERIKERKLRKICNFRVFSVQNECSDQSHTQCRERVCSHRLSHQ